MIHQAYLNGISTRSVNDLAQAMDYQGSPKAMCRSCADISGSTLPT